MQVLSSQKAQPTTAVHSAQSLVSGHLTGQLCVRRQPAALFSSMQVSVAPQYTQPSWLRQPLQLPFCVLHHAEQVSSNPPPVEQPPEETHDVLFGDSHHWQLSAALQAKQSSKTLQGHVWDHSPPGHWLVEEPHMPPDSHHWHPDSGDSYKQLLQSWKVEQGHVRG